jgi:hypothetical protein
METMEIDNSSEKPGQRIRNNDQSEHVGVDGNVYRLVHYSSPEEAARSIWLQWVTILKLVNTLNPTAQSQANKND